MAVLAPLPAMHGVYLDVSFTHLLLLCICTVQQPWGLRYTPNTRRMSSIRVTTTTTVVEQTIVQRRTTQNAKYQPPHAGWTKYVSGDKSKKRCQGMKTDGTQCSSQVAKGKQSYCLKHAK